MRPEAARQNSRGPPAVIKMRLFHDTSHAIAAEEGQRSREK
jgi:hypothetical protein